MKVVFVGPSLPEARKMAGQDVEVRSPACQGDILQAVSDGATVIGLIDGQFEYVAPVWHKELLYALSQGVGLFGSSSMGALRAVECAEFGMVGIGQIFEDYMSGKRIDDADVALQHGPAELHYIATSVPMVNVDATLENAQRQGWISSQNLQRLTISAQDIFFKKRTWQRVFEGAEMDWSECRSMIKRVEVDQKRLDALTLFETIRTAPAHHQNTKDWTLNKTPLWRKMYG